MDLNYEEENLNVKCPRSWHKLKPSDMKGGNYHCHEILLKVMAAAETCPLLCGLTPRTVIPPRAPEHPPPPAACCRGRAGEPPGGPHQHPLLVASGLPDLQGTLVSGVATEVRSCTGGFSSTLVVMTPR